MPVPAELALKIIQFTDPYCTWCWGSEPIMRHIEVAYGSQVAFDFIMGGLVEDVAAFHDPLNKIGGPEMARQVAEHWREASARHGRPVDADVWLDMKDEFKSTWPANIAVKAAQFQDEKLAAKFLRRLREAAAAERRLIHRTTDVQAGLAEKTGLDREQFMAALASGAAEQAFLDDLEECRRRHVTGFPSFLISNNAGDELMFFGYQPYQRFVELFGRLASRLAEKSLVPGEEAIFDFVRRFGKVAPREVAEVFSLPDGEAADWLGRLENGGLVKKQKVGNGWFCLA